MDCLGQPISHLLFPADVHLYSEATKQLLKDDSHTVELRFRLRVADNDPAAAADPSQAPAEQIYEMMEGKGMLMHDRSKGEPTHVSLAVSSFT